MDTFEGFFGRFSVFSDVDFRILYDWLPSDIEAVITTCIAALLVLALLGLIRRFLLN